MNEDDLWDRPGPADADVERFERVLSCLRFRFAFRRRFVWSPLDRAVFWHIASLSGSVTAGAHPAAPACALRSGHTLRTAHASPLTFELTMA